MKEVSIRNRVLPAKTRSKRLEGSASASLFWGGRNGDGTSYVLTKDAILNCLRDANGIIELDASLVLTGDFAIYSTTKPPVPSIVDSIPLGDGLAIVDGKLTATEVNVEIPATLGELTNVGIWANGIAEYDRIMYQAKGSSLWEEKKLSDIVGLDEKELSDYLSKNSYLNTNTANGKYYRKSGDILSGTMNINVSGSKLRTAIYEDSNSQIIFGDVTENSFLRGRNIYFQNKNGTNALSVTSNGMVGANLCFWVGNNYNSNLGVAVYNKDIGMYRNTSGPSYNKRKYQIGIADSAYNYAYFSAHNDDNALVREIIRLYHDGEVEVPNILSSDVGFYRRKYSGSSWTDGYGALNVEIFNNSYQTPLIVAYRAGQSVTGSGRLFSWEFSNDGNTMRWYFGDNLSYEFTSDGTIIMNNDFTIANNFSDRRLKTNFKSFDAHSLLSQFGKVVEFDYTEEALMLNPNLPSHDFNFIAQNVQKVMPQLVGENYGYLTLNLHKRQFISLLAACEVQTISKLSMLEKWKNKEKKEIEQLKKENINLRKRVSALEGMVNGKSII